MTPTGHLEGTPPDPAAAISLRALTKRYGAFTAVDGLDLDVARGEVFGFLGPNGSGKTTTIRMLTGTVRPQSGSVLVLGEDVVAAPGRIRRRIGYMSQRFSLFEDMTVEENLRFYAGVHDLSRERFAAAREYVLSMADLHGREHVLTAQLSTGWRQRLALGAATIHQPDLLFLDEPTSGVDPVARRQFWDLLYDLARRGVTLLVTTHYMEEASHCTRLAFLHRGRLVACGSPAELRTIPLGTRFHSVTTARQGAVLQWLERADGVVEAHATGARVHAAVAEGIAPEALQARLAAAGLDDARVVEVAPSMDDVFVALVTQREAVTGPPPPGG